MTRLPAFSAAFLLALVVAAPGAASTASAEDPSTPTIAGVVLDATGAVVPGASVTLSQAGQPAAQTQSDAAGRFTFIRIAASRALVSVSLDGFATVTVPVTPRMGAPVMTVVLTPVGVKQQVTVRPDGATRIVTATRTDTPLRDVPQAVSVVSRDVMAAQAMQGLADVVRYVPGVGMAQGEGNRDAPIFRGNSSTADFFVDGVRDDVQYFRDLYNVERVEVMKGPNAMMFGRGGAGGVLNRVTREATWSPVRQVAFQGGSFANRRITLDVGQPVSSRVAARVTGVYENSESFRQSVGLERYGLNPTVAATLGARTAVSIGYEHFHDARTADRGIPSALGRPVSVAPSLFFGDPDASRSQAAVDAVVATVRHDWRNGLVVRTRTRYAGYDKFYQNVYPTGVVANGPSASLAGYNNATTRRNMFVQADLVASVGTGPVAHTLVAGTEIGRQVTANRRNTGYFGPEGATSAVVPIDSPTVSLPMTFRPSATDADNRGVASVRAAYVQDQAALWRWARVIAGVRVENFAVTVHNNRTAADLRSNDVLLSPRVGVIFKPRDAVSVYTNYSVAYLPRAGEQLSSLTLNNQALDPERFRNAEAGVKWDSRRGVAVSAAVYRLERSNVAVVDPTNPSRTDLVKGQVSRGIELEANGHVTGQWTMIAGYAFQAGRITSSLSATALAGARLAQLPAHSFSLWNKYDFTPAVGAGLGVIRRSAMFTSTDNLVVLPGFTRCDAAFYLALTRRLRAQANIENLFDTRYYASANGNHNITPGSPRAARVVLTASF